ncbi:MAG: hypothetical protein AABX85_00895 [Nanoarchaeota archaeon]
MTENEKTNLTLRISKEVVDKARELGLNLSSITESMLKTENLAEDEGLVTPHKVREVYRKIFMQLLEITQEWNVYMSIGEVREDMAFKDNKGKQSIHTMDFTYYLSPHGSIEICDEEGETRREWRLNEDWPVNTLFEPDKLIESLVNRLYREAETNKEKLQKLSLLKNVLEKIKPEKKEESKNIGEKDEV